MKIRLLTALFLLAGCSDVPPEDILGSVPAGVGPTIVFDITAKPLPTVPLPNDVATRLTDDSFSGRYVNVSELAPTFLEADTRVKANRLDGFGTFMPISVSFSAPLDLEVIDKAHQNDDPADDVMYLVDIDPKSPEFGRRWPLDLGSGNFPIALEKRDNYFENDGHKTASNIMVEVRDEDLNHNGKLDPGEDTDWDGVLDQPNYIRPNAKVEDFLPEGFDPAGLLCEEEQIPVRDVIKYDNLASFWEEETLTLLARPVLPLRALTRYAVILTTRLTDRDGNPIRSPWPGKHHATQAEALSELPKILPDLGLSKDDVAFAWTYTTGSNTRELEWIRAGLYGHGKMSYLHDEYPVEDFLVDQMTTLPKSPYYAPIGEFDLVLALVGPELSSNPATREAMLEELKGMGGIVAGEFVSPSFLIDRDGIATEDYPANDDEIFEINHATGEAKRGPEKVTWWCMLPKRDKAAHGDNAIILFTETEDGKLNPVLSEDEKIEGSITIHSLVIEQDDPETKALKKKEVSEGKS